MFYTKIQDNKIFFEEPGTGIERKLDFDLRTGKKFQSEDDVRAFIEFCQWNPDWQPLVLNYYIINSDQGHQDVLEVYRKDKYAEAAKAFETTLAKSKTTVEGIGEVDAGTQYFINVITLIDISKTTGGKIMFKMYDNTSKELTTEQLQAVKLAIQMRGIQIYQKKWDIEQKILTAKTIVELDQIKIEF